MIEEYQKEEFDANEMARLINVVSTKDKDKEKEKEEEREEKERLEQQRNPERYLGNQKIQLCIALLQVGCVTGCAVGGKEGSVGNLLLQVGCVGRGGLVGLTRLD